MWWTIQRKTLHFLQRCIDWFLYFSLVFHSLTANIIQQPSKGISNPQCISSECKTHSCLNKTFFFFHKKINFYSVKGKICVFSGWENNIVHFHCWLQFAKRFIGGIRDSIRIFFFINISKLTNFFFVIFFSLMV